MFRVGRVVHRWPMKGRWVVHTLGWVGWYIGALWSEGG